MLNLYLNSLYSMLVTDNPVKVAYKAAVDRAVSIQTGPQRVLSVHEELQQLHNKRNELQRLAERLPDQPRRLDVTR